MDYREKYNLWINSSFIDEHTKNVLRNISDEKEIEDRFYKDLEFGTGGLRGVIGEGTNRLNIYTIGKATEGLSQYLNRNFQKPKVAIAYDSRHMSKEFAQHAAKVLTCNNIKVYLFEELTPTPILSYAVRELKCSCGIVITASHNPSEYNGYKVYGEDGGQVTDNTAKEIIDFVNKAKIKDVIPKDELLTFIGEDIYSTYIEKVKSLCIRTDLVKERAKYLKVIYTPIHGSGNKMVRRALGELGYENLKVVKEQELPNGDFPTVKVPNPEYSEVFSLALKMSKKEEPDIIIGTDPDCDRMGVMIKDKSGDYKVLTGNQVGVLLSHYILSALNEQKKLTSEGTLIKTIVTTEMIKPIAKAYNVDVLEVLTGFKYIGELIGNFKSRKFLFGFEESYGYLSGDFVRDKDAVIASTLLCEMALYYKSIGKTLYDALIELYNIYGFYKEKLISKELKGIEGMKKINEIMTKIRGQFITFDNLSIKSKIDYKDGVGDLPKSNVVKFIFEDDSYFVIRPSGTEPKIKIYLGVKGNTMEESENKLESLQYEIFKALNI